MAFSIPEDYLCDEGDCREIIHCIDCHQCQKHYNEATVEVGGIPGEDYHCCQEGPNGGCDVMAYIRRATSEAPANVVARATDTLGID